MPDTEATGGVEVSVGPASSVYQIPAPELFSFKAEDWEQWQSRFLRFRSASGLELKSSKDQVNSLIYLMGAQAESIFQSFKLSDDDACKFDIVLARFKNHFVPTKNIIYERYLFHTRYQKEGESVDDFVTALHTRAQDCKFPVAFREEAIRDQVVVGIRDKTLSEKLQLDAALTLEKAVNTARQSEVVKKQQEAFRSAASSVDRVSSRSSGLKNTKYHPPREKTQQKDTNKDNLCFWCGHTREHKKQDCPARTAVCSKCKIKGHYARVCKSKSKTVGATQSVDDDAFVGETSSNKLDSWHTNVKISGKMVNVKVDTGADVSVMPVTTYKSMFANHELTPADRLVAGPGGERLNVFGIFQARVSVRNVSVSESFYVVQGATRMLLGLNASENLGLVRRLFEVKARAVSFDPHQSYPDLFQGLGNVKHLYSIKINKDAVPFAISVPRRVPLPLKGELKKELDDMCAKGVIEPISEPTEWCAPLVIVPRRSGRMRLCVDLSQLNKAVEREYFPIPDVNFTLGQLEGAKVFSKLDANNGFWQIPLSEDSMSLTTFITPFGRFKFRRLPFGLSSAPEVFQKRISQALEGLEGVVCHFDDVVIFGKDSEEHDSRLDAVLKRLRKTGWTLNKSKCEFRKNTITLLGHVVSKEGVVPDPSKAKAILEMPVPTNVTELKRFLGMINFLGKFVPNLSSIAQPLYELLRHDKDWYWGEEQAKALKSVKRAIAEPPVLALYDSNKETLLSVDSSSHGLGAVLMQRDPGASFKPVAFASRTLSQSEKRYAQIEKEATAIAWGCEKFCDYITGKSITVETDHKPLVAILGEKDLDSLTPRLQRIKMRLMRYAYVVKYTPGKELVIADTLSRSPVDTEDSQELAEEILAYVQYIISSFPSTDDRLSEIVLGQHEDPVCCELSKYCSEGWPARHSISQECVPYWQHRNRITLQEGLLMKDSRIVIPQSLRKDILDKLHNGHQGISKCRSLAKQSVWWPGLSTQLEELVKNCVSCIKDQLDPVEPLIPSELPQRPWQVVGTDLLKLSGQWFLIVADYYSRFFEIAKLKNLTSECVITHMKSIFARYGVPEVVRSDNGTQFSQTTLTSEYRKFAKRFGFNVITSSPNFAQSNGFIESQVKNFKNHFKKSEDPYLMLLTLRSTPLENGYSPAELLMGRKIRGVVPIAPSLLTPSVPDQEKVFQKEKQKKLSEKEWFDRRHRAKSLPELSVGQKVWISDRREEGEVESKHESPRSYMVRSPGGLFRRNRKFLHRLPSCSNNENSQALLEEAEHDSPQQSNSEPTDSTPCVLVEPPAQEPASEVQPLRRSNREIHPPVRLDL
ncbi:uncharacterized protein K02A2.6-like [Photinus pyralis]|uniref:uncharacterized protein K02A2.6-like n=1 Tax=Photinus pyralis TaxID=7054 RepID=UPI001267567E|nr:uncharacterized protein K02A2.6-like [Photinus pyralis]